MSELPPEPTATAYRDEQEFEARRRSLISAPALAILVASSLVSLLVASLPFLSQAASGAFRGIAFTCFGLVGIVFFGYTWWHRQPIKIKGGLAPDRPFFYHLASAILFGTSFMLVVAGASLLERWFRA